MEIRMSDINDKKRSKKELMAGVKIVSPQRKLPAILNEIIDSGIPVLLAKDGYYVKGFYGLSPDSHDGYAFVKETNDFESVVFFDAKGGPVLVKTFKDAVKFNNDVWGAFYKISEDFKKPDPLWFGLMLKFDVLSIAPGGK